jgi:hypothetical protein
VKKLSNARSGPGWAHLAALVPAVLLPLLAVGFTVEPALRLGRIDHEADDLRNELGLNGGGLPSLDRSTAPFDRQAGEMLAAQLRELVPAELDMVEVYGAARVAAETADVVLTSIQVGVDQPIAGVGRHIGARGLSLIGRGSSDRLPLLVRHLRALGFPCEVQNLNLAVRAQADDFVDFQLGLGLFHRAPAFSDANNDID